MPTNLEAAQEAEARGVPFVVSCVSCDTGDEVASIADALRLGWTDIRYDPDGCWWNFLGHCPDYDHEGFECHTPGQQELFP